MKSKLFFKKNIDFSPRLKNSKDYYIWIEF